MQKRRKRLLALLLAGAMILNLGGFQIGATEVRAEETQETQEVTGSDENVEAENDNNVEEQKTQQVEEANQNAVQSEDVSENSENVKFEDKYPTITSIKTDRTSTGLVNPGDNFNIIFHVKAPEGVTVSGINVGYVDDPTSYTRTLFSTDYGVWQPGREGVDISVPVKIGAYASARQYKLGEITINFVKNGQNMSVVYVNDSAGLTARVWNSEISETEYDTPVAYNNELDFETAENENGDSEAPIINSVKVLTNPVATAGKVEVECEWTEKVSGIESIILTFTNQKDGTSQYFYYSVFENTTVTGENRTVTMTNTSTRTLDSTYVLESIWTRDKAGNQRNYSRVTGGSELMSLGNQEAYSVSGASYTVTEEAKVDTVVITGISCVPPEGKKMNELAAGDDFTAKIQLKNNTKETQIIKGISLTYGTSSHGHDHEYVIQAGETINVDMGVRISSFAKKATEQLSSIAIVYNNYSTRVSYSNYHGGYLKGTTWLDGSEVEVNSLEYNGELDYEIIEADKPDDEAPYINSISVLNADVKAPGWLELALDVDDGNAKLTQVNITLGAKNSQSAVVYKQISVKEGNLYYSLKKGCYIVEMSLPDYVFTADYHITNISVDDEALRGRNYSLREGTDSDELYGYQSQAIKNINVHITNTEGIEDDGDTDAPKLKGISVKKKDVESSEKVTWTIDAEEAGGLSNVTFVYANDEGDYIDLYATADDVEKQEEGKYVITYQLPQYVKEGTYQLKYIWIQDDSVRENGNYYRRNGDSFEIDSYDMASDEESVPYQGEADLNITTAVDMPIIDYESIDEEDLETLLDNTDTKEMCILSTDSITLTKEAVQIIKDKKMKVIFVFNKEGVYTEVVINGEDITDSMIDNIGKNGTKIYAAMCEEEIEDINFGNAYDQAGYVLSPHGNDARIPYTIRIKVSEKFYKKYMNSNIRLSKEIGKKNVILKENLKFAENHMLEVYMENAEQSTGDETYYVSTDTVKLADYNLEVEATAKMSSNIVTRGSSFQYEIAITNNNSIAMKNVAVLGMLMDRDGEVITDDILKQLESEDVTVSYSEETGWVIDEIPAGRTIRLIGTYSVEGVENLEKVKFCIGVGSASEDAGEDAMESFGMSDEQILILTDKTATLKGDINLDGKVTLTDLLYMMEVMSGKRSISELPDGALENGDVAKNDGKITLEDLMTLLYYLSGRNTSFEA